MGFLQTVRGVIAATFLKAAVEQTICWGTREEAVCLGCPRVGTRRWAHAWIRRHMEALPLSQMTVLDAGSGLSNRLLDWYRPRVRHAYLVDFLAESREEGNTTILRADLEKDIPLPDGSVDLVTSASSIEHLSGAGQVHFMAEAHRLLRPGGIVVMTVSYVLGLDERALAIVSRDPALLRIGCTISARLDLRAMLAAAPSLACPRPPRWERFPGFEGFLEQALLHDRSVILDRIGGSRDARCLPETDALNLRWAEIGIYLVKHQPFSSHRDDDQEDD